MAKAKPHKEKRNDLERLVSGLEFYRTWVISSIREQNGTVTQADLDQIVMPGSDLLEMFDAGNGSTGDHVLRVVRKWYAHKASELSHLSSNSDIEVRDQISHFLSAFRTTVGFDFYSESGLLRQIADTAIKHGSISCHNVYVTLSEIEDDLSQNELSDQEMKQISELLRAFEDKQP